jgi:nicotinamidase/pyrazinamidase
MKVHLIIVDPQNDFCVDSNGAGKNGALVVPGAKDDMIRTASMIDRIGDKLDEIYVTLDSHQVMGIERPTWWKNVKDGSRPAPFTVLGLNDNRDICAMKFDNGVFVPTEDMYTTFTPSFYKKAQDYLASLNAGNRYPHCVWPIHCVIGTWGWSIVERLSDALCKWEDDQKARVNYVVKGNNPFTEHFSGVKAEVPDPEDISTNMNAQLIESLEQADLILITGEALSHCVANTVRDIANTFSDPRYIEKLVLLTDASSNVGGFEFLGDGFIKDLTAKGMKTSTTVDILM